MKPATAMRVIAIAQKIEYGCWLLASGVTLSFATLFYITMIY
jgi:hypothetical protein